MTTINQPRNRPVEIVLTGGACSGKTTSLGILAHLLRMHHVTALTVPEAFTLLVNSGISGSGDMGNLIRADGTDNCEFQAKLFRTIRGMRHHAQNMTAALATNPVVIIYDRGELDALAFHDHDCFDTLAAEEGTSMDKIRDSYTAVMHLVTTADGAGDFYSQVTNTARWESVEEATRSDRRLFDVWVKHPHHYVFDNSTDFQGKLERILHAILDVLEVPVEPAIANTDHFFNPVRSG